MNHNFDAGHSHGRTLGFVTGCPLCDAAKEARNQAIAHLHEALDLLSKANPFGDQPTVRLNLSPIGITGDDVQHCHSIDLSAKQFEALADAVDSMNAYLGSESPIDQDLRNVAAAIETAITPDEGRLAQFKARYGEAIWSGEWSAAAVAQKNPALYADVTDLFDEIDPLSYLDDIVNSDSPEAAQAAFEQLVTGEWDGEL